MSHALAKCAKIIDDEVKKQSYENICKFAIKIAKTYNIPIQLVMKLAPECDNYCKGIKKGGIPCTSLGKYEGYCLKHQNQSRPMEPIKTETNEENKLQHNHTFPPMFSSDCPACKASRADLSMCKLIP